MCRAKSLANELNGFNVLPSTHTINFRDGMQDQPLSTRDKINNDSYIHLRCD